MARSGKETVVLLITALVTAGLAGGGLWFFMQNSNKNFLNIGQNSGQPLNQSNGSASPTDLVTRLSSGDKILVAADTNPNKQEGVSAIAASNFPQAIAKLQASLQDNPNDPEALIYLNNAKIGNKNALAVAVSVPIGGNLNVAKEILRGVAQAQDEVNQAGGINGKAVKVIISNDDNDPAIAKQIAAEFVKDTSILAVIGHNSSNVSLAVASIYQAGGLVMISSTSTAKSLSGIGSYAFRTVPSVRFQADALSRYGLKTARKNNFAICASSSAQASQSMKEEFTSAVFADGGKVSTIACDLAAPDFNPNQAIAAMLAENVEALLISPDVEQIDKVAALVSANQGKLMLLGDPTLYTFKTLQMGRNVNDMVLAVPWHPTAIAGSSFPRNAVKLWGGDVNWRTATTYDAMQAILGGLQQTSTRAGLQKTLSSSTFAVDGAAGKIQFQPSGDRISAPIFVKIAPGNRSGTGYDFVALSSTNFGSTQ